VKTCYCKTEQFLQPHTKTHFAGCHIRFDVKTNFARLRFGAGSLTFIRTCKYKAYAFWMGNGRAQHQKRISFALLVLRHPCEKSLFKNVFLVKLWVLNWPKFTCLHHNEIRKSEYQEETKLT